MDDSSAANALKIFLRIACQDIAEQFAGRTFKSTFGMVLGGSLRLAIGPVNYLMPVAEVASWLAQVGIRTYVYWSNQKLYGGTYQVIKDGDDVNVVANRPDHLADLPIELPTSLQFPWADLYQINPRTPADRTLAKTAFQCGHCGRRILHGKGGHRPDCPLYEPHRIDPAIFLTRRTLPPGGHAPASECRVSSHTCQDCGRRIDRVDDFEIGHAASCRVNGFHRLTEPTTPPHAPAPQAPARPARGAAQSAKAWQCPTCERVIQMLGDLETGHAEWCPQRATTWLLGAGRPPLGTAASTPPNAPQTRCRTCGQTVVSLRGYEMGHGANCPHNPDLCPS